MGESRKGDDAIDCKRKVTAERATQQSQNEVTRSMSEGLYINRDRKSRGGEMIQLEAMWSPDMASLYKGHDAKKVAEEILSISDEPTKQQIVEKARDESTELHSMFEWDDSIAGERWREEQARHIVKALKITYVNPDGDPLPKSVEMKPIRMLFGNPSGSPGFVSTVKILGNKTMYEQLLERAKRELQAFRNKYLMLTELNPIFEMIDQLSVGKDSDKT